METTRNSTVYPVILAVPEHELHRKGREKVAYLSRHARTALEISAKKFDVPLGELIKDKNGAPLPFNGNYWSLAHKPSYVGGVVATTRIGMDIEKLKPCSTALFNKTAEETEWSLSDMNPDKLFFRYWTAKESVLKASGVGIRDLLKCRIIQVLDDYHLIIDYKNRKWNIEHLYFDGHIASVVKDGLQLEWILIARNGQEENIIC